MRNLICVHWGTDIYPVEYVVNLWRQACRHSRKGFNFHVFTDNAQQYPKNLGWCFHGLQNRTVAGMKAWWHKIEIFNQARNLTGRNVYVDLDVVIANNIDQFWEYNPTDFVICQDFNRAFAPQYPGSNSSVMAWNNSDMHALYDEYNQHTQSIVHQYRGDQDYIHNRTVKLQKWWPTKWAMSWKWEVCCGGKHSPNGKYKREERMVLDPETAIIVFHGNPKPHEVVDVAEYWR